jgi:hypothetical protein
MLSWLRGSAPGKLVGQTGTILAVVKRKSTGPCSKLCLAQKVAAANAGSPASRVALSDSASAWLFSPIRLAKLANSPSIRRCAGSSASDWSVSFVPKEFAVAAFAAQIGVEREVELSFVGQFLLNNPMAVLENIGAIACPAQLRLHRLELGLGVLGAVQEILEIFAVGFAEHPPLVPPAEAKPPTDKPKADVRCHHQNNHSCS